MIYIDFQGGAHGNFLEFVCNTLLARIKSRITTPFNQLGASHRKGYAEPAVFYADHYFLNEPKLVDSKIISIKVTADDLLPLSSISLLRAGDYNYNNDELEVDTYNKLNNIHYRWVLDIIIDRYFLNQVVNSYNRVRDSTWPTILSLTDFEQLPTHIKEECINVHHLELLALTPETPNCPRYILREFFKIGFKYPENSGFIAQQRLMTYDASNDVYYFPFSCFYDYNKFQEELDKLAVWSGYKLADASQLHSDFVSKQPYTKTKSVCDVIINRLLNNESFTLPKLDLLQESYISAQIELRKNCELPLHWFSTSNELLGYVQ